MTVSGNGNGGGGLQTSRGQAIEDASMRIIEEEIKDHGYSKTEEWHIVRRVIHATADFDFATEQRILFHEDAVDAGVRALQEGRAVIVDVNGVIGGMNKQNPKDFGNRVICNISDPGVAQKAKEESLTRSQAAMRAAASDMDGGIVAIGNAPTALREVLRMAGEGAARPALVIGMPVGFVDAAESKAELARQNEVPYITNAGRKGGSPTASAMINALYKILRGRG